MSDLRRFLDMQRHTHADALRELKNGQKLSHWLWWEIPQIAGLGQTPRSKKYAIRDMNEAKEYLANDTLKEHLIELCEALLGLKTNDIEYVMGYPDDLKLRACMTLFSAADPRCETFRAVLDKYFDGKMCEVTLDILNEQNTK